MGIRHLICAVKDGEYKLAQYGQWDGYPSGVGASVLSFLKGDKTGSFKENLSKCSWATEDDIARYWSEFGIDTRKTDSVSFDVYQKFSAKHPQFSRDTGSDILNIIASSPDGVKLRNDCDFSKDSLFCEWAYVIDFDENTFEVYKGFNNRPLDKSERFYTDELVNYEIIRDTYYPVRLFASFDLSNLPSEESFLSICEPPEEDEEEIPAF